MILDPSFLSSGTQRPSGTCLIVCPRAKHVMGNIMAFRLAGETTQPPLGQSLYGNKDTEEKVTVVWLLVYLGNMYTL